MQISISYDTKISNKYLTTSYDIEVMYGIMYECIQMDQTGENTGMTTNYALRISKMQATKEQNRTKLSHYCKGNCTFP